MAASFKRGGSTTTSTVIAMWAVFYSTTVGDGGLSQWVYSGELTDNMYAVAAINPSSFMALVRTCSVVHLNCLCICSCFEGSI